MEIDFCLKIESLAEKGPTHQRFLALKGLMERENGDSRSKIEDYDVIEQIGRGAFAAAFLVLHKTENKK